MSDEDIVIKRDCDRCSDGMPRRITARVVLCFDCYDYVGQLTMAEAAEDFATRWDRSPVEADLATVRRRCFALFCNRRRRLTAPE